MMRIAAKTSLSVLALLVFGAIGLLAAEIRPFDSIVGVQPGIGKSQRSGGPEEGRTGEVPVPPYSEQVLKNRTKKGDYIGYTTKLSMEGLKKFYTIELPRRGWEQNEVVQAAQKRVGRGVQLLSFRKGAKRCMIYFEAQSGLENKFTVLLMNEDDFKRLGNREN